MTSQNTPAKEFPGWRKYQEGEERDQAGLRYEAGYAKAQTKARDALATTLALPNEGVRQVGTPRIYQTRGDNGKLGYGYATSSYEIPAQLEDTPAGTKHVIGTRVDFEQNLDGKDETPGTVRTAIVFAVLGIKGTNSREITYMADFRQGLLSEPGTVQAGIADYNQAVTLLDNDNQPASADTVFAELNVLRQKLEASASSQE